MRMNLKFKLKLQESVGISKEKEVKFELLFILRHLSVIEAQRAVWYFKEHVSFLY
jgi:hypothetical protein